MGQSESWHQHFVNHVFGFACRKTGVLRIGTDSTRLSALILKEKSQNFPSPERFARAERRRAYSGATIG